MKKIWALSTFISIVFLTSFVLADYSTPQQISQYNQALSVVSSGNSTSVDIGTVIMSILNLPLGNGVTVGIVLMIIAIIYVISHLLAGSKRRDG